MLLKCIVIQLQPQTPLPLLFFVEFGIGHGVVRYCLM